MPATAHIRCDRCGTTSVVFPFALHAFIPEVAAPGLTSALGNLDDEDGLRFTIADEHGHFNCPQCQTEGYAPQSDLN